MHQKLPAGPALLGATRVLRRIAHISDVHMLETGPVHSVLRRMAIRLVSAGRAVDARARTRRLRKGLAAAVGSGADHLVISGDLTQVGAEGQFEAFDEELADSGILPENITLVPGNHDAYTSAEGWRLALDGPLRAYRATSAEHAGKVVDRGEVIVLPLDVTCYQAITRSAGELRDDAATALEKRLDDPGLATRAVVVVQHHPPFAHDTSAWQWLDGLRGADRLVGILGRHEHVQVLHGHLHKAVDRIIGLGKSRVFGAPAKVEDDDSPRVRLYDVRDGQLESVGLAS